MVPFSHECSSDDCLFSLGLGGEIQARSCLPHRVFGRFRRICRWSFNFCPYWPLAFDVVNSKRIETGEHFLFDLALLLIMTRFFHQIFQIIIAIQMFIVHPSEYAMIPQMLPVSCPDDLDHPLCGHSDSSAADVMRSGHALCHVPSHWIDAFGPGLRRIAVSPISCAGDLLRRLLRPRM